jgi:hypothetical protein
LDNWFRDEKNNVVDICPSVKVYIGNCGQGKLNEFHLGDIVIVEPNGRKAQIVWITEIRFHEYTVKIRYLDTKRLTRRNLTDLRSLPG